MNDLLPILIIAGGGYYLWQSGALAGILATISNAGAGGGSAPPVGPSNPNQPAQPAPSPAPAPQPPPPTPPATQPPAAAPVVTVPHATGRVVSKGEANGAVYYVSTSPAGLWWFPDFATFTAYGYTLGNVVAASATEMTLPVLGSVPPVSSGTSGLGNWNPWNV